MQLPDHGANPHKLYSQYGMEPPLTITDFSENVHPFGPPQFIENEWHSMLELIGHYPDPDAEPFRTAAAKFHAVRKNQVAAGNGAAEIFTWLARRYRNQSVVLIQPGFSEYRKTLDAENAKIQELKLRPETGWNLPITELYALVETSKAVYICNPHSPTGHLMPVEELLKLAEFCQRAGCELVVDEAFIDFAGENLSLSSYLDEFPELIIVRSMTKMYAIPGLRLGYVLASERVIRELKQGAAHWNVNALAAFIGSKCFLEQEYRKKILDEAKRELQIMKQFLKEHDCIYTNSAANFLSFRLPDGKDPEAFFEAMLRNGKVLRHTHSFKGMDGNWFRVGMKSAQHMQELREAIAKWLMAK
ncbi:MAG TPA: aminotransferase class I/II-fold pyridoxal phosphate-dependent enzyme [Planococcus sp. (in: firmicutes)]|nr:aminotransferase class I/II-fold pyridoxal phosphate-dependent enzyme [Planococcus sp. (in: firmicutes)]